MRLAFVLEVLPALTLHNFRNNSGNILSCAILELLLAVPIETKICEDVWWWEVPTGDHS